MGRLKNLPIFKKRAAFVQLSGGHRPCRHELMPLLFYLVGTSRLELLTPSVSRKCSSHLSYAPTPRGEVLSSENHPLSQQLFLIFFYFLFSTGCSLIFASLFARFFRWPSKMGKTLWKKGTKKAHFFRKKCAFFATEPKVEAATAPVPHARRRNVRAPGPSRGPCGPSFWLFRPAPA